jgi:hypothetical protein
MKATVLFLLTLLLGACSDEPWWSDGYHEVDQGEIATVYACGDNWEQTDENDQLDQVAQAFEDWGSHGIPLLDYQGLLAESGPYMGGHGVHHCIWLITADYPTKAGRDLWSEYVEESNPPAGGVFLEKTEEIAIFYKPCPADAPAGCRRPITGIVNHEVGHGLMLNHSCESKEECDLITSLMEGKGGHPTSFVQPMDCEAACGLIGCQCEPTEAPQLRAEETDEFTLGGCGTE